MELLIQNKLIQWILQPLASLSNRLPVRLREAIFVCAGSMIFGWNILYNASVIHPRYLYTFAFGCLMAGVMLFCSLPVKLSPIRFDKRLLLPWYGVVLFMLISGLTNSVDYLADTMLYLVMFPVFYIVWNNGSFRRVLQLFTWVCRVVLLLFFIVSLLFFPVTGQQYMSCFGNPNGFAFFLTGIFCFLLLSVLSAPPKSVLRWVDLVLLGIVYALIYYSNSRTGQLAVLVSLGLTVLFLLILERKRVWKTCVFYVFPILLSLVVFHFGTLYLFQGTQRLVSVLEEQTSEQISATPGETAENPQTETNPSLKEIQDSITQRQAAKTDLNRNIDRISAGRLSIWKGYLAHITFWGHGVEERFTFDLEGIPTENFSAHMVILEFAYKFGALAGLLFLAFNLIAGFKSIVYALRHSEDRWALAPFTVSLAFGVISVLASTVSPYMEMIVLCYYIVQCPLMKHTEKEKVSASFS